MGDLSIWVRAIVFGFVIAFMVKTVWLFFTVVR